MTDFELGILVFFSLVSIRRSLKMLAWVAVYSAFQVSVILWILTVILCITGNNLFHLIPFLALYRVHKTGCSFVPHDKPYHASLRERS